MFLVEGKSKNAFVGPKSKSAGYFEILDNYFMPIAYVNYGEDFYLFQNNAPIHNDRVTKEDESGACLVLVFCLCISLAFIEFVN